MEGTGVLSQLIRDAKEGRSDLWLDLTNAYSSTPHRIVEITLEKHHIPQQVKGLILNVYSKFSLRV